MRTCTELLILTKILWVQRNGFNVSCQDGSFNYLTSICPQGALSQSNMQTPYQPVPTGIAPSTFLRISIWRWLHRILLSQLCNRILEGREHNSEIIYNLQMIPCLWIQNWGTLGYFAACAVTADTYGMAITLHVQHSNSELQMFWLLAWLSTDLHTIGL